MLSPFDPQAVLGIAVAILGGAAVGVERQRSGHATGPHARFGGIRTFTLLGAAAGIAGSLLASGFTMVAAVIAAGGLSLIVAGYVRASERDIDATTEVAALVVMGAGALAGLGQLAVSAALTTLTVLLLAEKPRLHRLVERIDERTLLAAVRFAVMAVVILPLLPAGPYGPAPGVRPRELWMLVLLFSGMSFVGFVAQRLAGNAGYALAGLFGGLVSSTSVTLTFARLSRTHRPQHASLATGVVAASTILFVRVAVAVAVLDAVLLPTLSRYLIAPFMAGITATMLGWRSLRESADTQSELRNPLQFRSALEMAALFQVVLYAIHLIRTAQGDIGLLAGGFVLGLTDVDALTLSMARSVSQGTSIDAACRAIATGIIANSLMKAALATLVGDGRFRWHATTALLAIAISGAAALLL